MKDVSGDGADGGKDDGGDSDDSATHAVRVVPFSTGDRVGWLCLYRVGESRGKGSLTHTHSLTHSHLEPHLAAQSAADRKCPLSTT